MMNCKSKSVSLLSCIKGSFQSEILNLRYGISITPKKSLTSKSQKENSTSEKEIFDINLEPEVWPNLPSYYIKDPQSEYFMKLIEEAAKKMKLEEQMAKELKTKETSK